MNIVLVSSIFLKAAGIYYESDKTISVAEDLVLSSKFFCVITYEITLTSLSEAFFHISGWVFVSSFMLSKAYFPYSSFY